MQVFNNNVWRQKKHGFTLIELLAVIAVLSIMLVMAVPALQTLSKRGLRDGVYPLASTLRLARQHAISKRQNVWVVFAEADTVNGSPEDVHMAYRAFAVITTNKLDNRYEYISDWRYLPDGVYFDDEDTGEAIFNSYSAGTDTEFPFPNDEGTVAPMSAALFKPDGRAYRYSKGQGKWTGGGENNITLTRAEVQLNESSGAVDSFVSKSSTNAQIRVRIRNPTGSFDVMKGK